jgi:ribosomal-protein-alanine N-acetyltransferase
MLRNFLFSDISQILTIEKTVYSLPWTSATFHTCLQAGALGWVAEEADQIIGFIILTCDDETCHILNIAVLPVYQRRGVGRRLLMQALSYATTQGALVTHLEVRVDNEAALLFYQEAGFQQTGVRKNYYPLPDGTARDALLLSKRLSP